MFYNTSRPFFYIGKIPVTVVGLIILAQLAGMITWVIYGGIQQSSLLEKTAFIPAEFLKGEVWRLLTYSAVSPVDIMALIGLYFFFQFGTAVESALGRSRFVILTLTLLILAPVVALLFSQLASQPVAFLFGCHFLSLAVFCGFCVMHPNMPFFILKIPMKWIGLVFFLGTVLSLVGIGDFSLAVIYMLSTVFTVWMIQCKGLALVKLFPDVFTFSLTMRKRKKANRKPIIKTKMGPKINIPEDTEIDKILDKVNEQGLHSLTDAERKKLKSQ